MQPSHSLLRVFLGFIGVILGLLGHPFLNVRLCLTLALTVVQLFAPVNSPTTIIQCFSF